MLIKIQRKKFGTELNRISTCSNDLNEDKESTSLVQYTIKRLEVASEIAQSASYKLKVYNTFSKIEEKQELLSSKADSEHLLLAHCEEVTVDLVLVDNDGKELDVGTEILEESCFADAQDVTQKQLENKMLLRGIMLAAGFKTVDFSLLYFQLP